MEIAETMEIDELGIMFEICLEPHWDRPDISEIPKKNNQKVTFPLLVSSRVQYPAPFHIFFMQYMLPWVRKFTGTDRNGPNYRI